MAPVIVSSLARIDFCGLACARAAFAFGGRRNARRTYRISIGECDTGEGICFIEFGKRDA